MSEVVPWKDQYRNECSKNSFSRIEWLRTVYVASLSQQTTRSRCMCLSEQYKHIISLLIKAQELILVMLQQETHSTTQNHRSSIAYVRSRTPCNTDWKNTLWLQLTHYILGALSCHHRIVKLKLTSCKAAERYPTQSESHATPRAPI